MPCQVSGQSVAKNSWVLVHAAGAGGAAGVDSAAGASAALDVSACAVTLAAINATAILATIHLFSMWKSPRDCVAKRNHCLRGYGNGSRCGYGGVDNLNRRDVAYPACR